MTLPAGLLTPSRSLNVQLPSGLRDQDVAAKAATAYEPGSAFEPRGRPLPRTSGLVNVGRLSELGRLW